MKFALLTISDTRTPETDKSGKILQEMISSDGHEVVEKKIVVDDKYKIRAQVATWAAASEVEAVITTGGTGVTGRDVTPEAVSPLFDKSIEGFGELFRDRLKLAVPDRVIINVREKFFAQQNESQDVSEEDAFLFGDFAGRDQLVEVTCEVEQLAGGPDISHGNAASAGILGMKQPQQLFWKVERSHPLFRMLKSASFVVVVVLF